MVNLPKGASPSPETPLKISLLDLEYRLLCWARDDCVKLTELEEAGEVSAYIFRMYGAEKIKQKTLDWCRSYLNMEFKLVCNQCGEACAAHFQDEISAPER